MGRHAGDPRRRRRASSRSPRGSATTPRRASRSCARLGDALGRPTWCSTARSSPSTTTAVPSFEQLQPRMQVGSASVARRLAAERPVVCMLFDVLWLDGHSTCELPYPDRRKLLERLALAGPTWQTPPTTIGDGDAVLHAPRRSSSMEGVVAKRLDSTYQPGRRSDAWRKVKTARRPGARRRRVATRRRTTRRPARVAARRLLRRRHARATRAVSGRDSTSASAACSKRSSRRSRATTSPFAKTPKLLDPHWVEPEARRRGAVPELDRRRRCCARRATGDCATTRTRPRWSARSGRARADAAGDRPATSRVLEVVCRIAGHPDALHHRPRAHVARAW